MTMIVSTPVISTFLIYFECPENLEEKGWSLVDTFNPKSDRNIVFETFFRGH